MVRVRWERVGRIALLVVLAVVIGLYAEHALSYLSTHAQASADNATVQRLTRENKSLAARRKSLQSSATIVREARSLGMVRRGEQPYAVTGSGH